MNFILTYFFIGTTYMFFLEVLADWLANTLKKPKLTDELTLVHRLIVIIIWPMGLVIFLYNFIKTKYRL